MAKHKDRRQPGQDAFSAKFGRGNGIKKVAHPHHNPRRRFGNYEIESKIGKGGMAEVYRARVLSGPRVGQTVAIKRLSAAIASDRSQLERFTHEADLCRRLDHPNIVRVYEAGALQGVHYIAMELIDGCDLGHLLRQLRQRGLELPIDFAVYLVKVLLDALAYAHGARSPDGEVLAIVHGDVSPANLFVSRSGEIKLGDFGIAKTATVPARGEELQGKAYYLSPEVVAGGEVSESTDLWAAAVTLYELLTLEKPFRGETPEAVFAAITRGNFVPAETLRPEIPTSLAGALRKGLAASKADRFGSAGEFARTLEANYDDTIGTPLAIAAVVRGLFGALDLV